MATATTVHAHGGGMDKQGCHWNRQEGTYHCHKGPLAGQTFANKAEAQVALGQFKQGSPPVQAGKTPSKSPAPDSSGVAYDRKLYGGWIDADGDCQDTRQEVLIEESLVPVTLDRTGCKVMAGRWYDPFTGRTFSNPRKLDIDHFVPLAEVHRSGGTAWASAKRVQYANDLKDPKTLIAVSASANRSKGAKDPADWLPPNKDFRCEYVRLWIAIKERWGLGLWIAGKKPLYERYWIAVGRSLDAGRLLKVLLTFRAPLLGQLFYNCELSRSHNFP